MSDQEKATSESNLLTRLQSLANGNTGVTIEKFDPLLKDMPEKITTTALHQLVNFASDQVGIWEAEWMFSPVDSPNTTAKAETERWGKLRGVWLDMLLEHVPDAGEQIERGYGLTVLKHTIARRVNYNKNKPLQRLAAVGLSKVAFGLNRLGFKSVAQYLYAVSLYPKGTMGRTIE